MTDHHLPLVFKPDDNQEQRQKISNQKFWLLWVPLGAILGLFASLIWGGGVFLPVWGICVIIAGSVRPVNGQK